MTTEIDDNVTLDDKYEFDSDRIYISGVQALVRLPLMQRHQDALNGLNTAGFISGYRGSPLGGYDLMLSQAKKYLEKNQIVFEAGLNEDLGATAVWGSQQVDYSPHKKHDGVFGLWYGKGPGVDRSGDAFKHANAAGTSQHGGVLALIGDDHTCKSSTFPHQSEHAMIASFIPMLNPSSIQDILDMGLLGIAMSRYSGNWVGFKCLTDNMDSSASVYARNNKFDIVYPKDFQMPAGGLNIRFPDIHTEQEERILKYRLPAAQAFARANKINKVIFEAHGKSNITVCATGKSYSDFLQALELLGISIQQAKSFGVSFYKIGLVWPVEPTEIVELSRSTNEFLVLEEKRSLIEQQIKTILFNEKNPCLVVGKTDEKNKPLLTEAYELNPILIANAFISRLARFMDVTEYRIKLDAFQKLQEGTVSPDQVARKPYYCSGCPHNTSTKVPEGSRALAGIGCHYMAQWIYERTDTFTQMGGEGVPWIGQSPFTNEEHVFVNLGDGTYNHSGSLAIRACHAAKVNITFKILYNDAVAMTGGQKVDGGLYVDQLTRQIEAEDVKTIYVVSDDIEKYKHGTWDFAKSVKILHRREMPNLQKEIRHVKGVSVIVYDQTCAAEKRRRRKRKLMEDPKKRVFINEQVCEGCGDCGKKSNCVSILPVETELGRKRQIDQSSCNKDYSCVEGFCPSFVTVHGVDLKKPEVKKKADDIFDKLIDPVLPDLTKGNWSILLPGIGGTGVVTIGALIAMAAHLEGKGGATMDQIGLAQKGGAVMSHIKVGLKPESIHSFRVGMGEADVILGADLIVSSNPASLSTMSSKTKCVINTQIQVTGDFTKNPDWKIKDQELIALIENRTGKGHMRAIDATKLATALLGNSIATNMFMLGFAYQLGLIPVHQESLFEAIELNAVSIDMNKKSFLWGRLAAQDEKIIHDNIELDEDKAIYDYRNKKKTLEDVISYRVDFLTQYQNKAYADRYLAFVNKVKAAESKITEDLSLTKAVAQYLFKLMAYKDEYEVARLYTETSFMDQIKATFQDGEKLKFHLAPPLLAKKDKVTGELQKQEFGSWIFPVFKGMAKLKVLRGTPLDIFGYTQERQMERRLINEYRSTLENLLPRLNANNHAHITEIASLPEEIRGFGHVKEESVKRADKKKEMLLGKIS